MYIYLIDSNKIEPHLDEALAILDEERKNKALKYKFDIDKYSSIAAGLFINKFIGFAGIKYNKYGKPYKDGNFFNLSHSNGICIFAYSDVEIGIDIEIVKDINPKLIDYALTCEEKELIKDNIDFYKIWTHKEAITKRDGIGLTIDLKKIDTINDTFFYKHLYYKNYVICVSSRKKEDVYLKELNIKDLL